MLPSSPTPPVLEPPVLDVPVLKPRLPPRCYQVQTEEPELPTVSVDPGCIRTCDRISSKPRMVLHPSCNAATSAGAAKVNATAPSSERCSQTTLRGPMPTRMGSDEPELGWMASAHIRFHISQPTRFVSSTISS